MSDLKKVVVDGWVVVEIGKGGRGEEKKEREKKEGQRKRLELATLLQVQQQFLHRRGGCCKQTQRCTRTSKYGAAEMTDEGLKDIKKRRLVREVKDVCIFNTVECACSRRDLCL